MAISRRRFFQNAALAGVVAPFGLASVATAQELGHGLVANGNFDQTAALQLAMDTAANASDQLFLPAGRYLTSSLKVPSGLLLTGVPGRTLLSHTADEPLLLIEDSQDITISGLVLDGNGGGGDMWHGGLVHATKSTSVIMRDCQIANTALNAISFLSSSATIENCSVSDTDYTGIFVLDGQNMRVVGNRVFDCRNGGIRIWRGTSGFDGSLITGNIVSNIDWRDGGNGQNGNGINVFQADGVIVANNSISDCTFSAIRLNTTNNTHIVANTCLNSGEVAIFSEFSFTGSIIADNIVDGASGGISITNFNDGGRLATCTGNIVRNLTGGSKTNPDLEWPYGIAAEADAVIANNVVENVAGAGIVAGWGPYLRDVMVTGNLVREVDTGISISVAPEAGAAVVLGNTISAARVNAIAGTQWWDVASADLAADAGRYPQLTIGNNTIL